MSTLPEPHCRLGYTKGQLSALLGDRIDDFYLWMEGQTVPICDGLEYDYGLPGYRATECGPHGPAVYAHDLRRFLAGSDPLDWVCGAFQPTPPPGTMPYRCTQTHDHTSDNHQAVIDGEVVATWPQR